MPADPVRHKFGVYPDVLKLGLVSFLTDLSSEMIFSVFAIFLTTIAGASAALLGVVEGLADLSASSLNYLAGYGFSTLAKLGKLSDRIGHAGHLRRLAARSPSEPGRALKLL